MMPFFILLLILGAVGDVVAIDALGTRLPWEDVSYGEWSQASLKKLPTPTYKPPKNRYLSVRGKGAYIAFTFDDGPRPWTHDVLDALKERNLKATFYVVGTEALNYPKTVKRIVDEGHELGNHTMTHAYLHRSRNPPPLRVVEKEIRLAHETIVKLTGIAPRTMRPPGGLFTLEQSQWMHETFGYADVRWSVDPGDGARRKPSPATFKRRVMSQVHNGAIILSHDLWKSTVAAVPSTLDALLVRGYEFLTVSELLALDDPYEVVQFTDEDLKVLQQGVR
ncbi:MAG: polysaccharide deacetylase family protein [Verrucomicrobiaceae bacterium]|jgi:peptidoglycan/xylan/chitin deacetylase (PgdA/CDA1 family)|nr:polysaccharide deacetylase family protein [Verrucomicrobiales bacterium]MDF1788332.1 polysaccharide deacetylase family protein [Verrucomicrobiales bacterium]NCF92549.1 polysaccharide deacetylase family protein [Verrucomicrobiaceae bacterium]